MKKSILFTIMLMMIMFTGTVSHANDDTVKAILSQEICIIYNDEIKSFHDVNGVEVKPILYAGTTYLPIRAISALFDIPVEWDGENNKIYLGSGDVSENTVQTLSEFKKGTNSEIEVLLVKERQIEYKEKVQTFKDVNGAVVYPLACDGTTYLPVRAISNLYGASIDWNGETKEVTIKRDNKIAKITNVTLKVIDDVICAVITTDNPLYDYKYTSLSEGANRIYIDLQNSEFAISKTTQVINYGGVQQVRFGEQGNNVNRVVLDVEKIDTYTVVQSDDRCTTYLALSSTFEILPDEQISDEILLASIGDNIYINSDDDEKPSGEDEGAVEEKPSGENISSGETSDNEPIYGEEDEEKDEDSGESLELTESEKASMNEVSSITYSSASGKTKISISGRYKYDSLVLSDPVRLVIDIDNAYLNTGGLPEIEPVNQNIKEIRFSQNKKDVVRIVFELKEEVEYEITEKTRYIEVSFEEPEYENVRYEAFEDYATLTLYDVNKSVFSKSELKRDNQLTLGYNSSKFETERETIEVEDKFLDKIQIRTNKIILTGTGSTQYSMKQDGSNVVVTMTMPEKNDNEGDFVVLIDAGHGGTDPGAVNGDSLEKVYTLAIMLELKELLEDTPGIVVKASRTDDVFINREGRYDFILDNEDADLLVSIHINSLGNKNYKGAMTLYYNKPNEKDDYGITSKELATIIQSNLIDELDMIDRGIVVRDDLWILEQNSEGMIDEIDSNYEGIVTNLPAVLCEIGFLSNDEELARIKTEEFQESAAFAIYNGIMEAKEIAGK